MSHLAPLARRQFRRVRNVIGIGKGGLIAALALGAAAVAHATERWSPEGWFTSPAFTQSAIADRVTEGPDTKLYASFYNGAQFDGVRGQGQLGALIRLHSGGALDDSFSVGSAFTDIWAVAFQTDGRIIVGGILGTETVQTGQPLYRVFRLNTDGSIDPGFQSPVFGDIPRFITVMGDNSMVVVPSSGGGGNGGITTIARLTADGALAAGWSEPDLDGGVVFAPPVVDGNGKIYIGGIFSQVNGQARPGVARLNANGTLDETFVPSGFNPDSAPQQVRGIGLQTIGANAGKLIVAGGTLVVPGSSAPAADRPLIRLNPNGSLDSSFSLTTQSDAGMYVRPRMLEVLPDDSLVIVGGGVARFTAEGVLFDSGTYARPAFSEEFYWMEALADGSVVVAPQIRSSVNGAPAPSLVKFLASGAVDPNFTAPEFTYAVYPSAFKTFSDGRFLAWGNFDEVNGQTRAGIARFNNNGSIDGGFYAGSIQAPAYVSSANVSDDGRVLATVYNPATFESNVLSLNSDGSLDTAFALDDSLGGNLGALQATRLRSGSILLVGLNAQRVFDESVLVTRITSTGAIDDTFDASGLPPLGAVIPATDDSADSMTMGYFDVLAEDNLGRLIVRTAIGPYSARPSSVNATLIRLNANGTVDPNFNAPVIPWPTTGVSFPIVFNSGTGFSEQVEFTQAGSPFQGATVQDDGSILVYGLFNEIDGQPRPGLARLDQFGALDLNFTVGSGAAFTAAPNRIAQVTDVTDAGNGRVWVSGYFDQFGGRSVSGLVQLESTGEPVTDFQADLEMVPYAGGDFGVQQLEWPDRVLVGGTYRAGNNEPFPAAFHRLARVPLVELYAQPRDTTLVPGQSGTLRADYINPQAAVTLQWYFNGQPIAGATGLELPLDGSQASVGNYQLQITGGGETLWSDIVNVNLATPGATWLTDTSFTSPEMVLNRLAGRVTSDGAGGYYGTFVNGSLLNGANDQAVGAIVHLTDTGAVDTDFDTGAALVNAWAVQPLGDGRILVGGLSSNESAQTGQPLNRVFRLSATGALDPTYRSPVFGGLPRFITLQPDGKAIVVPTGNNGGNGGVPWIARLNVDGSLDETFHQVWLDDVIFAPPVVDPVTGKIYLGGSFSQVDGQYRPSVARLNADGTLDTSWVPSGFNPDFPPQQVRGLALQTQGANAGKLLIAGGALLVTPSGGSTISAPVIRLNANGTVDSSFTLVTQADAGMAVRPRLMHLLDDDRFLVVGSSVTRFLANGAIDPSYAKPAFDQEAYWFAADDDGSVVVPPEVGTRFGGQPFTTFKRFDSNGAVDPNFIGPQFQLSIYPSRFAPLSDGRILTWGEFTDANGTPLPGILRMNANGTIDSTFSAPSITLPTVVVFAELFADGRILATTRNLVTNERGTVRLFANGALDTSFTLDPNLGSLDGIETKVLDDDTLLVWSASPQYIIDGNAGYGHLFSSGTLDDDWGPEDDLPPLGAVYRNGDGSIDSLTVGNFRILAVDNQDRFIARTTTGNYAQRAGALPHTIRRYLSDGTIDPDFNAPTIWWGTFLSFPTVVDAQTSGGDADQVEASIAYTPFNGAITQDDGKVIVFGSFNNIAGQPRAGIARLNENGTLDTTFNPGSGAAFLAAPNRFGQVSSVQPAADGKLWVSGFFDTFDGYARSGLVLLNADGSVDAEFGTDLVFRPYLSGGLNAQLAADGSLLVAGTFEYAHEGVAAFHRLRNDERPTLSWRNPLPAGGSLETVIHDGTRFIAAGTGSRVIQSVDGINWTQTATLPDEVINALAFSGTTYVAVGGGGGIYTSTDLNTWTLAGRAPNFQWLWGATYANGRFVVVGDNGNLAVSTDSGATWFHRSTGGGQTLQAVADGNGKLVAVGHNGQIWTSNDSETWTQASLPSGYESTPLNAVKFLNGQFVAVGGSDAVFTSTDGSTWTPHALGSYPWLQSVTYTGADYVVVGNDNNVLRSSDLGAFTQLTTSASGPVTGFQDAASAGGVTVAVGSGGVIRTSTDGGQTWRDTGSVGSTSGLFDVKWINGEFVAVGSSGTFMTSTDGVQWNLADQVTGHWLNAVAYGAGHTVLATSWGVFVVKPDGGSWSEIDLGDGYETRDLIFVNGGFIGVGPEGRMRKSADGVNWTTSQIPGVSRTMQSIAFKGGVGLIVGDQGLMLRTTDGVNWAEVTSPSGQNLRQVRAMDGLFVAVGDNRTVLLSTDGLTWRTAPVPNDYFNFGWGYADVRKGYDAYYVVSSQGRVLKTTDWVNWTQFAGLETKPNFYGLAFGAGRMVVVGDGGAILSTDAMAVSGALSFPSGGLPAELTFANGGSLSFGVFATANGPLSFAWSKDGAPIAGETTPQLHLSGLSAAAAGDYTVTVTGPGGATLQSTVTLSVAGLASGSGPIFGIGDLPGGAVSSEVRDATLVDGVIHAVGWSVARYPGANAFGDASVYWRSDLGLFALPEIEPNSQSTLFVTASAITPNAAFIAARSRSGLGNQRTATRIDTANFGITNLPQPPNYGGYSASTAISDDGRYVAGFYFTNVSQYRGFLTDTQTDAVTVIAPPDTTYENAFVAGGRGLSADGSVAVGNVQDVDVTPGNRAFRFTGSVMTLLPFIEGGTWNEALGVSADGMLTLMRGNSTAFPSGEIYLHQASDDSLVALGSPDVGMYPYNAMGMSDDGSVVAVSFYDIDTNEGGVYIRNQHGWFTLAEAAVRLGADLDGWDFTYSLGMSRNGQLVFGSGTHHGQPEGFVVQFPANFLAEFVSAGPLEGAEDKALIGAWTVDGDDNTVVLFTEDGSYLHLQALPGEDVTDTDFSGFEYGQFDQRNDGSFRVQTEADYNGEIGLSGLNGRIDVTLALNGDAFTLTIPGDQTVTLHRVVGSSGNLFGGWLLDDQPGEDGGVAAVFLPNGDYFLAEEGDSEGGGFTGLEHGTFAWNAETGVITATSIDFDGNGEWGLSHPNAPLVLTLTNFGLGLNADDGESSSSFHRVVPPPVDIVSQPQAGSFVVGDEVTLSVAVAGDGPFTYQWRFNGQNLDGETGSTLSIGAVTEANAGLYDVVITGPNGTMASATVSIDVEPPAGRALVNVSGLMPVGNGEWVAVPFRIEGEGSKQVLLRAVSPAPDGIPASDALPDPRLRLVDDLGFEIGANDDWDAAGGATISAVSASVGAFPLVGGSTDAALVALLEAGNYVMLVSGEGVGRAFVELYDADAPGSTSRLVQIGFAANYTRTQGTVFGFVNERSPSADLLMRVVGTGLGFSGASSDPQGTLYSGNTTLAGNDNWAGGSDLQSAFVEAGAPGLNPGSTDAAFTHEVAPGTYTFQVGGFTGRALAEVYDLTQRAPSETPVLLIPPQSANALPGDAVTFEAYAAGAGAISYQWFHGETILSGETNPTLHLTNVSAADAGDYVLKLTNGVGTYAAAPVSLTVVSGPMITAQPSDSTINSGATATLSVGAQASSGSLTYQWYAGASGDASAPVSGATGASFTTPALDATTTYWVRVSDAIGSVDSDAAIVTVLEPSNLVATHEVIGSGFRPGQTVEILATFSYSGPASAIGWQVDLPAGWSYASTAFTTTFPNNTPGPDETGTIAWIYSSIPTSPITLRFSLNVPETATDAVELVARALFRDGINDEQVVVATPSPLIVNPAPSNHSADTDGDSRIGLSELLRVIEIYNTRFGTSRTGHYRIDPTSEDGFAPNPTLSNSESGGLTVFHTADSDRDGKFNLSELLRVIELYNFRQGTTRTGEYHVAAGSEDGFAPGPAPQP